MVSFEKIVQKFQLLDEAIGLLPDIVKIPLQEFLKDKVIIGSAKYYLQVSIECCLDVTNHIIASEGFRPPRDYADSFKVLQDKGLISENLELAFARWQNCETDLYTYTEKLMIQAYINSFVKI